MSEEAGQTGTNRHTRLIFNIGGQRHEAFLSTLKAIPGTRLSWIADNYLLLQHSSAYDPTLREFFFDRNPNCFGTILNYYRTGQLHYPSNVCGPAFQCELKFWGIDEAQMQSCCWESYSANRDKDAKLKGFKGPRFQQQDESDGDAEGSREHNLRLKVWKIFDDAYSSKVARAYSYVGYVLLFLFVLIPILSSMELVRRSGHSYNLFLKILEYCVNAYFTIELLLKFLLCPQKKVFVKDFMNLVDLMSLTPVYLHLLISNVQISDYTDILAVFRIIKVFRFFRYNYTLQVLVNTLKESFPQLSLLAFLMLILATMFAYASYFVEGKETDTLFISIPRCLYWAFITMTTVGYGDMAPKSWFGQVIGVMCAICGLLMVALPVSIIATNFSIYYSYARARISLPPKKKVKIAADANSFIGQDTMMKNLKENSHNNNNNKKKRVNRVAPLINGCTTAISNHSRKGNKLPAINGQSPKNNELSIGRKTKLPPINTGGLSIGIIRFHNAVSTMKEKGWIKPKRKMDLATLVMVLSSEGEWQTPN